MEVRNFITTVRLLEIIEATERVTGKKLPYDIAPRRAGDPAVIVATNEMAKKVLPQKVAHYAEILGVTYGRITIRSQKSLCGSCSAKGNLNFNCLLMLAPNEVIDYVVVHELCHRLEMNHSQKFWNHVRRIIPDYREKRRWLREEGNVLMKRMTAGQFSS